MCAVAPSRELYDPLLDGLRDDLYEIYRHMRDDHPVYLCERLQVWCLTRFQDAQEAARDWETFSNANGVDLDVPPLFHGEGNFLDLDPPRHDVLRKAVRPFFTPQRIAALEEQIARRAQQLTERLSQMDRIDVAQDLAWAMPVWVICRMLGAPQADDELVHRLVSDLETRRPGDVQHPDRARPILRRMHEYIEDLAERKRRSPGDDVMSALVAGEREQAPRREEILGLTALLFTAGSMAAAALIGNTLRLLSEHPGLRQALRAAPDELIAATIEESLRLESPAQYLARRTTRPARIHDREIPSGADVILVYGAANRDERRFERAQELDVHRPTRRNLAFGEGIHFCLGAPLARMQARIVVPAFLRAVPEYEMDAAGAERFCMQNMRGYLHLPATIG